MILLNLYFGQEKKCLSFQFCYIKMKLTLVCFLLGLELRDICHRSKEKGKDQESIQSSTTPDPGHHLGK